MSWQSSSSCCPLQVCKVKSVLISKSACLALNSSYVFHYRSPQTLRVSQGGLILGIPGAVSTNSECSSESFSGLATIPQTKYKQQDSGLWVEKVMDVDVRWPEVKSETLKVKNIYCFLAGKALNLKVLFKTGLAAKTVKRTLNPPKGTANQPTYLWDKEYTLFTGKGKTCQRFKMTK